MRISDWSSDVCSSDLALIAELIRPAYQPAVGEPESARLMRIAVRIAQSDATVLIEGETGTGKEGMARFVHVSSNRSEEHTSELQSLMRNTYAVFCLKKKNTKKRQINKKNTIQQNK